jgi:hypothetical protein
LITFKLALEAGTKREGRRKGVKINSLKVEKIPTIIEMPLLNFKKVSISALYHRFRPP